MEKIGYTFGGKISFIPILYHSDIYSKKLKYLKKASIKINTDYFKAFVRQAFLNTNGKTKSY